MRTKSRYSNTKAALIVSVLSMCLGSQVAVAAPTDELAMLAQQSGCLACHRGAGKGNGPAYKEVAARYAGRPDAVDVLSQHILKGTGPEGLGWMKAGQASLPFMPANNVSAADARRLAQWVLATQGEIANIGRLFVTEQLTISGKVKQALTLDVASLRAFPQHQVGEVSLVCQSGADKGKLENFKGVRLTDILDRAGIVAPAHNDVKKLAIIATASDGYKAVFSWNELYNSPLGSGVLVFFEKNGQPLGDDEGRIAMVSAKDARTGPRHVKWLQDIEVRRITD